jgi:hypothetical protein
MCPRQNNYTAHKRTVVLFIEVRSMTNVPRLCNNISARSEKRAPPAWAKTAPKSGRRDITNGDLSYTQGKICQFNWVSVWASIDTKPVILTRKGAVDGSKQFEPCGKKVSCGNVGWLLEEAVWGRTSV